MTIEIIDIISHPKGMLYSVEIDRHTINILLLFHAIERMKKWGISDKIVIVYFPYIDRYFRGGRVYEDKIFKGS
jgi:hypothetical protein